MKVSADLLTKYVDGVLRQLLLLASAAVFALWYANVPGYLDLIMGSGITQIHWVAITATIVILYVIASESWDTQVNYPLIVWWILFMTMNLAWFALGGGGDPSIIFARLAGLSFLAVAYFAFRSSPDLVFRLRRLIAGVVVLSVALNCYQLLNPFAYVPLGHEFEVIGRAAGIYVNPNSSGAAIVIGMVLSAGVIPPRWRGWFVAFAAIGAVSTISRAAVLGYFIAVMGLAISGVLSRKTLLQVGVIAAVTVAFSVVFLWPLVSGVVGGADGVERLLWFLNPGERADFSANERTMLAEEGWRQFVNHPLVGNGVGSTELWALRASTHNQYLQLMSDFGIAGALVLPAMIGVIVLRKGSINRTAVVAMICVGLFGLVTHNIYNEYFWLVGIALAAALPDDERIVR
jgi:O-antigen ligase